MTTYRIYPPIGVARLGNSDQFYIGPEPAIWSFYDNNGWYDDISDGPVQAEIHFAGGTTQPVEPAWLLVAPPDFAPGVRGIVTLYDVICHIALTHFGQLAPAQPSFSQEITAEGLTRAVLDGCVGAGFFPGIEAGILVENPAIYTTPFDYRLDHTILEPGDMTALLALPWQADFWKCMQFWWPSQRPNVLTTSGLSC